MLGISVKDGQEKAIAISRGVDEAKTALKKAKAFYPGVAEIIQESISQESSEEFIIGCNTFFLAICENPSEELEAALVATEVGIYEKIVQDAYSLASDPAHLEQNKTKLSVGFGNVVSRLCEAIDISEQYL